MFAQELQDRVGRAKESKEELMKIRKEIVDFHGEMVLLENYSALNYTGKPNLSPILRFMIVIYMCMFLLSAGYDSHVKQR